MPDMKLDVTDAAELAEMLQSSASGYLTTPAAWPPPWNSSSATRLRPAQLRSDLERFVFLLGGSDGEPLCGMPQE